MLWHKHIWGLEKQGLPGVKLLILEVELEVIWSKMAEKGILGTEKNI